MKVKTPRQGGACVSLQGRDEGSYYIIIAVDGGYVTVADGTAKKIADPKKKNLKHVRLLPFLDEGIAQALTAGKPVYDYQIAYAVRGLREAAKKSEDDECQKAT